MVTHLTHAHPHTHAYTRAPAQVRTHVHKCTLTQRPCIDTQSGAHVGSDTRRETHLCARTRVLHTIGSTSCGRASSTSARKTDHCVRGKNIHADTKYLGVAMEVQWRLIRESLASAHITMPAWTRAHAYRDTQTRADAHTHTCRHHILHVVLLVGVFILFVLC